MKFSQIFVIAMAVLLLLSGCSEVPRSVSQPSEGKIETDTGLFFDAQTLSLTFGEDTFIVYGEEKVAVGGTVHDISFFADGDTIYFDPISKRITSVKYDNSVVLGEYHTPLYQCKLPVDMSQVYINDLLAATMEKLHDYKVVCLGDDLTEGVGTKEIYSDILGELCGFRTVTNYGLEGSSISPKVDSIPVWEDGIDSFCQRYEQMDKDADLVIVLGGLNDWFTGRTLGQPTDTDANTFYGAMKTLCEGLKEQYPQSKIVFFSSPQINYVDRPANLVAGTQWDNNKEGYNRKGYRLEDYAAAMEAVCNDNGVYFCSLTEKLPWGAAELGDNKDVVGPFGRNGFHPNKSGHEEIALQIMRFLGGIV